MNAPRTRSLLIASLSLITAACAGTRPAQVGIQQAGLAACPSSPNCVSSDSSDSAHRVAPFVLNSPPAKAWKTVRAVVAALPDTQVVAASASRLHAESTSEIFGFVDDLELQPRPSQGLIAVRSASRLGYGDMGVNRRRVEELRAALIARGVVR